MMDWNETGQKRAITGLRDSRSASVRSVPFSKAVITSLIVM